MTDAFDRFWKLYPRKVAKLEAQKAWKQMTREYDPQEIIAGLERNLSSLNARERQFIPHPATWLRGGRWMDEVEPVLEPQYRKGRRNFADVARDRLNETRSDIGDHIDAEFVPARLQ